MGLNFASASASQPVAVICDCNTNSLPSLLPAMYLSHSAMSSGYFSSYLFLLMLCIPLLYSDCKYSSLS